MSSHMSRHHQGAQQVESFLEGVEKIGMQEEEMVPNVQESVSVDEEGVITITLNNLSLTQAQEMEIVLKRKPVTGGSHAALRRNAGLQHPLICRNA